MDDKKMNDINSEINKILIPLLQDNVAYSNKQNKRLFIICMFMLIIILVVSVYSGFLVYKQNIKYQEFLSQFEFETEVYQQTDDNSSINSGIDYK